MIAARPTPRADVRVAAGDDAAVFSPGVGEELAATTDAFVEGRHFSDGLLEPRVLGARLAAANLSDLAAMAAEPRWALISFGLRATHDVDALLEFDAGLAHALAACGASLVGGNFTGVEGPEWMSLTLIGACPAGRAWTRAGAHAGDLVVVTGSVGRANAGLALIEKLGSPKIDAWWAPIAGAWRAPASRVLFALVAAERHLVRAAVDVSDGLAADLAHLCAASNVGAQLDAASWPDDALLARAAEELGVDFAAIRIGPSDDYELVLAVAPEHRAAIEAVARDTQTPLAIVGQFTAEREVTMRNANGTTSRLGAVGFDHFGGA